MTILHRVYNTNQPNVPGPDQVPPNPQYLPYPPPPPPAPNRSNRTLLIVLAVVTTLSVLVCAGAGTAAVVYFKRHAATPATSEAPVAAPERSDQPAPESPPSPTEPAPPALEPDVVHEGTGGKLIRLPAGSGLKHTITMTHSGTGGFAVTGLDDAGRVAALLGDSYGKYDGTMMLDGDERPAALQIRATGKWKVIIRDARKAPFWTGKGTGRIATVFQIDPAKVRPLAAVTYSHSGQGNFMIRSYDRESWDLLVNEIGKLQGETAIPAGTRFIEIEADGAWTFNQS